MKNMLRPTEMTPEQKRLNDRVLELRLKYNDFIPLDDDDLEDAIVDCSDEKEFQKITKQFNNRKEYMEATIQMEKYINRGHEVPEEIYKRIVRTRKDFSRHFNIPM